MRLLPPPHRAPAPSRRTTFSLSRVLAPTGDATAWTVGALVAVATRYDWVADDVLRPGLLVLVATGVVAQLALGWAARLYRGRHELGSRSEATLLAGTMLATGVVVLVADLLVPTPFAPRSVPVPAAVLALVLAAGLRVAVRVRHEARLRPDAASSLRVVVYGAGITGEQLVRSMMGDPAGGYRPVALLDDDPTRRERRIQGVAVHGTGDDVEEVARRHRADLLVIARRDPVEGRVRDVALRATELGVGVKVLPALGERLKPCFGMADLREVDVNELLGRTPVQADLPGVANCLTGRRVLVTGAGGSIGSELCRQIARRDPAALFMLDRDESALHAVQLSIYGTALLDSPDVVLADIRDEEALDDVFVRCRPEVVFHAAALKHLPMLEQYPHEAWKTNVLGTRNVLRVAGRRGVTTFVNVSTDKAAQPISVLGLSKRIGEKLVAGFPGPTAGSSYLSVRFGNVLGSRGSVLTTFTEQLSAGAPLTVTHPEVSRYFMTIPEAVGLVLQAAEIGSPGEVLVLDMGARVRIVDFARQLMDFTGRTSPIVFTGLRDGEKLHEDLFGPGEDDVRPRHPSISHVPVPPLAIAALPARVLPDEAGPTMTELCEDGVRPVATSGPALPRPTSALVPGATP